MTRRSLAATARSSSRSYKRGAPQGRLKEVGDDRRSAAPRSPSSPITEIFETTEFNFDTLAQRLRELAFLNSGVTITLDDERRPARSHEFHYEGGIVQFVEYLNKTKQVAARQADLLPRRARDGIDVEVAMQWNDCYTETVYSFVRQQHQHDRRRHARLRLPDGAHAHDQQVRRQATASLKDLKDATSAATTSAKA